MSIAEGAGRTVRVDERRTDSRPLKLVNHSTDFSEVVNLASVGEKRIGCPRGVSRQGSNLECLDGRGMNLQVKTASDGVLPELRGVTDCCSA